ILAITLVLCAVFIPCAFVSGITGRFFRQFALTISASTIISAINALTMTPSWALVIFRSGPRRSEVRSPQSAVRRLDDFGLRTSDFGPSKEALPWWIFGVVGGLIVLWLE